MEPQPELQAALNTHCKNIELESTIARIEEQLRQNYQLIIRDFFPYLLSLYKSWRPRLGEIAMVINLERDYCFEVIIRSVDGYRVRAQEGKKDVYHIFDLNPRVEEYEVASFVIPKQNYEDDIKNMFELNFLQERCIQDLP